MYSISAQSTRTQIDPYPVLAQRLIDCINVIKYVSRRIHEEERNNTVKLLYMPLQCIISWLTLLLHHNAARYLASLCKPRQSRLPTSTSPFSRANLAVICRELAPRGWCDRQSIKEERIANNNIHAWDSNEYLSQRVGSVYIV